MHHARSFFPLELFQQVGESAELLWVVSDTLSDDPTTLRLLRRLGTVVDITGLDLDQAAASLADHRPEGIVSFVDDHVRTAAGLAARLGLPYHSPEVADTVVDKRLQRLALQRAGIPGPRFWPVAAALTPGQVAELGRQITYPAVLKPAEGSGSRDMYRVTSTAELTATLESGAARSGWVLEEYLRDDPDRDQRFASYLSVESVISAGRVSHVAVTGRFQLAEPFRETGNFMPAVFQPRLQRPILAMASDAIEALGITTAVIHTEIKLTPEGPRLIEVNGRLGGRPPFVLESVADVNLFEVACQVAVGVPVAFEGLAECRGIGFWLMLQPPMAARRVTAVQGIEDVSVLEGIDVVSVNRRPGDAVDWREGTDGQVLTVRGRAADHQALADTIELIRHKVSVDYDE
jgi:hypothetical protein